MRVHHLNCATLCPPFGWTMRNAPAEHLVCHCLLIQGPDGLVLVDTGLGTADLSAPRSRLGLGFTTFVRGRYEPAETALAHVRRLGYHPADVRHVVLTHLDLDHAGGLADFPHAEAHVMLAEHGAAVLRPSLSEKGRYRTVHIRGRSGWTLHVSTGEEWNGFPCVRDVPGLGGEVLMIPLPGHSRGHTGVAVHGERGWILHAGDAYFHRDELVGRPPPFLLRTMERFTNTDTRQRFANLRRLQVLAADKQTNVRVFCAHDPIEFGAFAGA